MTIRASVAFFLISAVAGGAAMAVPYSVDDGLITMALLMITSAPVLICLHLVVAGRARLGALSRQFAVGIGLTVTGSLFGLWLVSRMLFVSEHDAFTMALLLGFAAALTVFCAWMLAGRVRGDIELVRDGLMAVGRGGREAVAPTGASDETAQLAAAANAMIRQIVDRESEREAVQEVRHELVSAMVDQLIERESEREATDRARRDLLVGVSHDTRTPLTSLGLLASAIADGLVDAETQRDYARAILHQVEAFTVLLDELFELARLEAGDVRWSMEPVALDALVAETVDDIRADAEARQVALVIEVPGDLGPVQASPARLRRVLVNLVGNAIRHTPAGGVVTVAGTSRPQGGVEVEVADTGVGIPPADRDRVFEPFFRGGEKPTRGGSGLGLAICRAIVEAHAGRIWLEDAELGTRVRFSLRSADVPAADLPVPVA